MKYTYSIEGMHCSSCIDKIKSALASLVNLVNITLDPPLLQIEADRAPNLNDLNAHLATVGNYRLSPVSDATDAPPNTTGLSTYYPIFLIAAYIVGVASINNFHMPGINWQGWMNQFMAGFFLVFSAFKFLDIRGFADGYATYDLLAKRWYNYGFVYPFLELGLGVLYLQGALPFATPLLTIVIMGFSSLGVINSMMKGQKLKCACLGTVLNVPLSSITLIEDLSMVFLAALSLIV